MSDQAMKLFEALSDVDAELLERCNRQKNKKIAYMFLWKYKKAMAACLCLFVVSALSWGGYQLLGGRKGATGSGSNSSAPAQVQDMAVPMESRAGATAQDAADTPQITAPEEAETEGIGKEQNQTTSDSITDSVNRFDEQKDNNSGASAGEALRDSSDGGSMIDNLQGSTSNIGAAEKLEKQKEMESASAFTDSRKEILWEAARVTEPFGSYLPTAIPAGYEPLSARQSSMPNEWNNIIFKWGNGEQTFYLNMTVGEEKTKDEIRAAIEKTDGLYQYPAEDFKREMIPEPMEDGKIMFTLYYSDGMQIDFSGNLTEDAMWELVNSISR